MRSTAFIRDAAKRGIFAYITLGRDASALQSSLDVVLSRFAEYQGLEGALAHRAITTERAKGILMERHSGSIGVPHREASRNARFSSTRDCTGRHRQRQPASQVAC